jgi:hypothetical protein
LEACVLRRHWILIATIAVLAILVLFASVSVSALADLERGRALYESRCLSCHDQSVHRRARRVALDFEGVRAWVVRWNQNLEAGWGDEEIDDVTAHLNSTYYRFPCPPRICPA